LVALLGIIALAGMINRNAVILISEVDVGMKNGFTGMRRSKSRALHRSRPIMLTASAAILGCCELPGMFSGDRWHLPLLPGCFQPHWQR
jgi:multidrug efflux pump subunit AcrB